LKSNSTRYLGIILGLLLVVVLILWNQPPGDLPVIQSVPGASPQAAAQKLPGPERAPALLPRSPDSTSSANTIRRGQINAGERGMVGEGQVEYFGDRSPGEPPSAFITEGFFSIPGGWKLDSPKPESFEYRTLDGCPSRVLECFWSGDLLTLTVGPPRELELHVHDLIGSPVAEAEIQVFASLPYRGNLMKTNSEGVAVVSTYSNDPTISVRVTAAGYDRLAMSANTQVTARLDIPLRRLFGVGIVHRPSPMIQDMGGVSPGDGVD